jgi:AraC-like DNA-binding protein
VVPITMGLQRAIPLVFSALAAWAAARHWRADLVEDRRRLRVFVAVSGIAYTLAFLAVRLGSPRGQLSGWAATLDVGVLLLIVGVLVFGMLRLVSSNLFSSAPPTAHIHSLVSTLPAAEPTGPDLLSATVSDGIASSDPTAPMPALAAGSDPAEDRLALALQHLMAVERVYRADDMSVANLAARLSVPEYRLRRLINQRLGYRNFNAFVNGYRLDAVRAALADPAQREVPVLTLALDAGFQSIGPFNRAFKAATGLTPTEFRREATGPTEKMSPNLEIG